MSHTISPRDIFAIGISIFLNASAQIFLRVGLRHTDITAFVVQRNVGALLTTVFSPFVLGGLGCYSISILTWMYVLSRLPVSLAYPMVSLVYVFVVIAGWALLNEQFSWVRFAGVCVILAGVWLVAKSA